MRRGWESKLRRTADRLLRPGGRAVVLLYHRVADEAADPYRLCIAPRRFEEHLQVVRESGRPIHLSSLAETIRNRRVPDRAVCITFDDGYADNLLTAKPLLERHDVPATVFTTTGRAGRDREFWWDALQRVFLEPARSPERLVAEIGGTTHAWELGAAPTAADTRDARAWHLFDDDPPSARHAAFRDAYELLRPLAEAERARALEALLAGAGLEPSNVRPSRRAMEPNEVAELARGGVVEVGAHTVSHPALPSQPPNVQRTEIARSKTDAESWVGAEVSAFAYPYGLYDASSVAAARDAGFRHACSCLPRAARRGDDPYLIPRIEPGDIDGDALAETLRWHLH